MHALVTLGLIFIAVISIWTWLNERKYYWKRQNVTHLMGNILLGNFGWVFLLKQSMFDLIQAIYERSDLQNTPFFGINVLTRPAIVLKDPELIKQMIVRDSSFFPNR